MCILLKQFRFFIERDMFIFIFVGMFVFIFVVEINFFCYTRSEKVYYLKRFEAIIIIWLNGRIASEEVVINSIESNVYQCF